MAAHDRRRTPFVVAVHWLVVHPLPTTPLPSVTLMFPRTSSVDWRAVADFHELVSSDPRERQKILPADRNDKDGRADT